jgi:hypothetical protein
MIIGGAKMRAEFCSANMSEREMRQLIASRHYTRSVPSGHSVYTQYRGAIIVFSLSANKNISRWLLGGDNLVWELSRMWAPDDHEPNLLTKALAHCLEQFISHLKRNSIPLPKAIISYADPAQGHEGGVYRAASWVYLGQSEESRNWIKDGRVIPRRAFHMGKKFLRKPEIEALGFCELKYPGKHRFAKGLTRSARDKIENHAARPKDETIPIVASTVQPCGAAPTTLVRISKR